MYGVIQKSYRNYFLNPTGKKKYIPYSFQLADRQRAQYLGSKFDKLQNQCKAVR